LDAPARHITTFHVFDAEEQHDGDDDFVAAYDGNN
jgi:hypothetical protein